MTAKRFYFPLGPYILVCCVHWVRCVYCVAYGHRYTALNTSLIHQPNKHKKHNKLNKHDHPPTLVLSSTPLTLLFSRRLNRPLLLRQFFLLVLK